MRRIVHILFLLPVFLTACKSDAAVKRLKPTAKYAKNFRIVPHSGFTEIQLLEPESGRAGLSYALVKRNVKVSVPANMVRIEVPVKRLAVLSTTHIGMLAAIDELGCVKGTTDAKYIANSRILKGIREGDIAEFTDETSVTPGKLVNNKIELVIFSGFGKEFPNAAKLARLGVFTMANYDWRETHPLGKAEWIKVFGYLTDEPEKAEKHFKEVEKTYIETVKAIRQHAYHPKVMAGSLLGDIWYAPAGESYMARILEDAGADYIYRNEKGTGSCEKSLTQVVKDQQGAQFWINPDAVSIEDLLRKNGKYALMDPVKKGGVFCYTQNSNYFWEMGAVNPHWILTDFATIMGTGKAEKNHFYSQLK